MELTEEQKAFKEESLVLLKQSNDADYASTLEKIDKWAAASPHPLGCG